MHEVNQFLEQDEVSWNHADARANPSFWLRVFITISFCAFSSVINGRQTVHQPWL